MGFKPKKCFVCGRIFVPTSNAQTYCSSACSLQYERTKRDMFQRVGEDVKNCEIDDYLCGDVFMSEISLRDKPSLRDRIGVQKLLNDFEIKCEVPQFESRKQMNKWKWEKLRTLDH